MKCLSDPNKRYKNILCKNVEDMKYLGYGMYILPNNLNELILFLFSNRDKY